MSGQELLNLQKCERRMKTQKEMWYETRGEKLARRQRTRTSGQGVSVSRIWKGEGKGIRPLNLHNKGRQPWRTWVLAKEIHVWF